MSIEWPADRALPAIGSPVRTTCPYCGVGCGVLAGADGKGGATIAGDPAHPANAGRLCSKGAALGETLGLAGRLLHPMLRGPGGVLERAGWDAALDTVSTGLQRILERHGPDAVAFYLSGQLLTEDYYVANKLMKGFLGSGNVDTNSRLCMASSVAGHKRAFGADVVPGNYDDLDQADLIVLVGSNAAWCHPILFQRMVRNRRERGAKIVVIDPRATATAQEADVFLGLEPGQDTALFCGLLVHLAAAGGLDNDYIAAHTSGFAEALEAAKRIAPDSAATARATGLDERDIDAFFNLFRDTKRAVTCFSQGVNQSAQGTDKVNAIINCHLATGRIGKPGAGPFSLTGQPNAMGGREVGGLSNQLAAHMDFSPDHVERVGRFWRAPRMAVREGLKAVALFEAIARGDIKALWVMGTNPAVSLPDARAMRDGLGKLGLFVVSENVLSNDTVNAGAHVLLPAAAWGEKSGTATNSERRISRQRAFLPLPGEAKPDWWIVSEVARRMGFADCFAYGSAADVFREHARLSEFENNGTRAFDIGDLSALSDAAFDALDPVQWPLLRGSSAQDAERFFGKGGFFTQDRKARFVPLAAPAPRRSTSERFPLRLNTGRIRDQWHTMTRTGVSARLGAHLPEPFVEIHPQDAARLGLVEGRFARVMTAFGAAVLKVVIAPGQRPGSLFVPIHWSGETASSARIGDLVAPDSDPYSGQPESKTTPATIAAVHFPLRGFILAREPLALPAGVWWARVAIVGGWGYLLAADTAPELWRAWIREGGRPDRDIAEYSDAPRRTYRAAAFTGGKLDICVFVGPAESAPQWDNAKVLFAATALSEAQRRHLLSGKSKDGVGDAGPVVCACFGVSLGVLSDAISSGRATTPEEIGKHLRAGTNCGSCLPELKRLTANAARPSPVRSH